MAFLRCGGGRATLKATTLWTNSSPSSSFSAQAVTLSNSMYSYDYIRVYFRYSTSIAEERLVMYSIYSILGEMVALGARKYDASSVNDMRYRAMSGTSATSISFTNSVQHTSSSQTTSGAYIIPTKIEGLKLQTI